MKHPEPKYEHIEVPRLTDKVKKMNGKSGQKLVQCIDELCDLLDKTEKQNEEITGNLRNTDTE